MTPKDIVTRAVQSIDGIRFPQARAVIERIFSELAEEGYVIVEERELRKSGDFQLPEKPDHRRGGV